jgi:A/G-specific adenine glycosylase
VISAQDVRNFRFGLRSWFRRHGRDLPWRRTRNPYAILVSECMLQQTQVAAVIPYYNEWLRRFPNFASLARASETQVLHAWEGLGYYARARNLHATAKLIVKQHGGRLPRATEEMRKLPGIGKYTAHAVATFAFDEPVPIVEANSARVLARVFNLQVPIDQTSGRTILWNQAAQLVPKHGAAGFNSALVDLGALVCRPRQPKCEMCPVRKSCSASNPEILPLKKRRPQTKLLTENHALVMRQNSILLQQAVRRWRGMWILPPLQPTLPTSAAIHRSVFPFTNYRVTLQVFPQPPPCALKPEQGWFAIAKLAVVPVPSPHRRTIQQLLQSQAQKLGSARAAA